MSRWNRLPMPRDEVITGSSRSTSGRHSDCTCLGYTIVFPSGDTVKPNGRSTSPSSVPRRRSCPVSRSRTWTGGSELGSHGDVIHALRAGAESRCFLHTPRAAGLRRRRAASPSGASQHPSAGITGVLPSVDSHTNGPLAPRISRSDVRPSADTRQRSRAAAPCFAAEVDPASVRATRPGHARPRPAFRADAAIRRRHR